MQRRQYSGRALRGSQFHLQNLINDYPEYLNCLILSSSPSLRAHAVTHPKWVSPLASDNYTEYQDEQFLEAIGFRKLSRRLSDFWPKGGPVWDALATFEWENSGHRVILVEAKSHILEMGNPGYACKASGKSLEKIKSTLATDSSSFSIFSSFYICGICHYIRSSPCFISFSCSYNGAFLHFSFPWDNGIES